MGWQWVIVTVCGCAVAAAAGACARSIPTGNAVSARTRKLAALECSCEVLSAVAAGGDAGMVKEERRGHGRRQGWPDGVGGVAQVWTAQARALGASTGFGLPMHARTTI